MNDTTAPQKSHFSPVNAYGETHYENPDGIKDATFCNFQHLYAKNTRFENCFFADCAQITAEHCEMVNCTFHNVNAVTGDHTDFLNGTFEQCCSTGPLLTIDSQGRVEDCTFDTITTLGEDGYVIDAAYRRKEDVEYISGCRFWDCNVETEDGKLCSCCYFRPFSSYAAIPIDNVDYETCEGV